MLKTIEFNAGINLDDTQTTAQASYISGQWVRFRRGKWEVMRGWEALTSTPFSGYARGAHSWQDNQGAKAIAWGTAAKLYVYFGGAIIDITPNKAEGTLTDPFTTVSGSAVVTVEYDQHGLLEGDAVSFSHATAVGGITVSGDYTVTEVLTANKFTITHGSSAGSSATGGGYVDIIATLDTGLVDGAGGSGYGTGTFGYGTYGASTDGDYYARTWSLDNWGENLLANPRGGALYEWQPSNSYTDFIVDGDFAASTNWTTGTGWSIGSGVATKTAGTASNLAQDIESSGKGGKTYRLTFDLTRTAGEIQIGINAGYTSPAIVDIGAPCALTGSYSRLITLPAEPLDLVFQADSSFAGTIDNVTLTLESSAYRIDTAPAKMQGMFVSSDRVVIAIGTVEADGDYNPLLARWSDRENLRTWIPAVDNIAGELQMGAGGSAVAGLASREQNIIWTDAAAYALTPSTGDNAFSLTLLGTGCGAIGPLAVAESSGFVFWVSRAGDPYIFQGTLSSANSSPLQKIVSPVRDDFFDNRAANQDEKIVAFVNDRYSEFWFLYADSRDGNEVSRYQAFNWLESHWVTGTIDRTTMIGGGTEEYPIGFGTDSTIYQHEKGNGANGDNLAWHIQTGYFFLDGERNLMKVRSFIPDFEGQVGNVTLTIYGKQRPQGAAATLTTKTLTTSTLKKDLSFTRRLLSIRYSGSNASTYARCGTVSLDVAKSGQKV